MRTREDVLGRESDADVPGRESDADVPGRETGGEGTGGDVFGRALGTRSVGIGIGAPPASLLPSLSALTTPLKRSSPRGCIGCGTTSRGGAVVPITTGAARATDAAIAAACAASRSTVFCVRRVRASFAA